ncbi:hypothetical protein F511_13097 [Dorcoceras hygrometricum]|uniref:Uncharacterized protein n=1 Tax=Dorcoceras hygrometricum TaxID=472368 RepID=A0A2Z7AMM1_9LAMI|nr:hypothetical protein F511_13097 [Dorcoceras hygrometricum]
MSMPMMTEDHMSSDTKGILEEDPLVKEETSWETSSEPSNEQEQLSTRAEQEKMRSAAQRRSTYQLKISCKQEK